MLRPALRTHRQSLAHLDIVNSQPALLSVLIEQQSKQLGNSSGDGTGSGQAGSLSIYDRRGFSPLGGIGHYRALATAGRLYEHLMDKTGLPRTAVKKGVLRDVFGKRGSYPESS